MAEIIYKDLSFVVGGAAMEVYRTLGSGFLKAVYQAALAYELKLRSVP
ncbi:MAG: GxxExxY protein [Anaerolineales bacterium]|jgi:GxxExxY protein